MAAIEVQEGDRAAATTAKAAKQAGRGRRAVLKGMPAAEIERRIALYDVAIVNWRLEWERLKAAGLAMTNAGPEPRKYWYLEANNPENIVPPTPPSTLTPSGTSCPRHRPRCRVIHSDSSEADIDNDLYTQEHWI